MRFLNQSIRSEGQVPQTRQECYRLEGRGSADGATEEPWSVVWAPLMTHFPFQVAVEGHRAHFLCIIHVIYTCVLTH